MDGKMVVQGNGLRSRVVQGPCSMDDAPSTRELLVRRYECQICMAVMTVVPAGVMRRCLFLGLAIAAALGRWIEGATAPEVRRQVSPQRRLGDTAARGWASLRRWARTAPRLWRSLPSLPVAPSLRQTAERVVAFLASHALVPTGNRTADAMAGAARAG